MPSLDETLAGLKLARERQVYRKIDFFVPYPKQQEFFDLGLTKRERLLMAGNKVGKTYCGAAEATFHATGEYPDDWFGRRYTHSTVGWVCGETAKVVRDTPQRLLFGKPGVIAEFGSGFIPKARIIDTTLSRAETDAFDTVQIEHRTNGTVDGTSIIRFKAYVQGRQALQSDDIDWAWMDEEPAAEIYNEILTRTVATHGMVYMTFTPLMGMSLVVRRFLDEPNPDRSVVSMDIADALHLTPEDRATVIAGYAPHERDARAHGIPILGEGLVYQALEQFILEDALVTVPLHWSKGWGIDFGIDHPFGAALLAWDRDTDVLHLLHCFKMQGGLPLNHARAIRVVAAEAPIFWPHDGDNREKGTGEPLIKMYKQEGLRTYASHAIWEDGSISVEAGIKELDERMQTGRFKVASHLTEFFNEKRRYHRKKGLIVKEEDDILDAVRYAVMMKKHFKTVPLGGSAIRGRGPGAWQGNLVPTMATGLDFDLS